MPTPGIVPGLLAAPDALFQKDDAFLLLKPRTQRDYLDSIKPALAWASYQQVAALTSARSRPGIATRRRQCAEFRRGLSAAALDRRGV